MHAELHQKQRKKGKAGPHATLEGFGLSSPEGAERGEGSTQRHGTGEATRKDTNRNAPSQKHLTRNTQQPAGAA
jgi:hypothetical protein